MSLISCVSIDVLTHNFVKNQLPCKNMEVKNSLQLASIQNIKKIQINKINKTCDIFSTLIKLIKQDIFYI